LRNKFAILIPAGKKSGHAGFSGGGCG